MSYNPAIHHRRSIRLKGYDYRRPGAYFFTSCVLARACIFGDVIGGEMHCNEKGRLVWDAWLGVPEHYSYFALDEFIVMPNHVHGILVVTEYGEHPMWEGIRSFKSTATGWVNDLMGTPGANMWQRDYWEHIIRNGDELDRIRNYIRNNPRKWERDRNHPNGGKRRQKPNGWDEW
jgi:REP element-mobilizing transposase RayT